MTKLKKIKLLFLTLNTICFLGFFQAKAMEKTPTRQSKKFDLNSYTTHFLKPDNNASFSLNVVDPQYEIKETEDFSLKDVPMGVKKFFLDGKCRFYKSNKDGKYYSVNFEGEPNFKSRCYDYLPAADERFQIKKHNDGRILYFYDDKPVYILYPEKDTVFYVDLNNSEKTYFSFKGKKVYYENDKIADLKIPEKKQEPVFTDEIFTDDAIDPKYSQTKVFNDSIWGVGNSKFCLNNRCRFYRSNNDGKYYSVDFEGKPNFKSRCYDYLPAVDSRFQVKRHVNGEIFYFYNGEPIYRVYHDKGSDNKKDILFHKNKGILVYVDLKNGEPNCFSFKGYDGFYRDYDKFQSMDHDLLSSDWEIPTKKQGSIFTRDAIDPQYEIRELRDERYSSNIPYGDLYFCLDGECVYVRFAGDEKYRDSKEKYSNFIVSCSSKGNSCYDYLPAVDSKYQVQQSVTGKKYYFYKNRPVYRLDQIGDKIYYINLKTGNTDFYSFRGKKGFHSTDKNQKDVFNELPVPGNKKNYDLKSNKRDFQYKSNFKRHEGFERVNYADIPDDLGYEYQAGRTGYHKNGDMIYYYYKKPAYLLQKKDDKIYYVNLKTNDIDFCSFKKKKAYFSLDENSPVVFDRLPAPLHMRTGYNYNLDLDVIDPQYEVVEGIDKDKKPITYFMVNGKTRFYKSNENGKYYNVNFEGEPNFKSRCFDYLPTVDDNCKIKKNSNGEIYYYQEGEPTYKVEQEGNKLYYVNLKTGNRDYYSFRGKTVYYKINKDDKNKIDGLYYELPLPENIEDDITIIKYPSSKYYDLVKKSKFFKPNRMDFSRPDLNFAGTISEEKFYDNYRIEKNDYDYALPEQMMIIKNFRINLYKFMESKYVDRKTYKFDFVNIFEGKNPEKLPQEYRYIVDEIADMEKFSEKAFSNFKKAYIGKITRKENVNQVGGEIVDPQFKVIKDREIEWYFYGGKLKFYKILRSGRIYNVEGDEVERLPRADQRSRYDVINENGEFFYTVPGKGNLRVTNEGNKTWFSVGQNKKFYSVKGKTGYVTLYRNNNRFSLAGSTTLNDIDVTRIPVEKNIYDDKNNKYKYKYVPDPQYEVIEHNGRNVYFYEGLPKYIKAKIGYRDIESGMFYRQLPIANAEYFWDKEYEVVKDIDNNEIYYCVNGVPVYRLFQYVHNPTAHPEIRLDYFDNNGNVKFFSKKGKRGYFADPYKKAPGKNNEKFEKLLPWW